MFPKSIISILNEVRCECYIRLLNVNMLFLFKRNANKHCFLSTQIREEGSRPATADIMKFAKLFEDEITLDNLSRQQLRACCTMLNITPIGTDALLRFLLEMKLRGLLADDKVWFAT